MNQAPASFEVFFDGECPLCGKEIAMLQRLDRRQAIRFTDISTLDFAAERLEKDYETLMGSIHGRMPDGSWVSGVEVFRQLYTAVGYGGIVSLTRVPGLSWLLDMLYVVFARNRLTWTGREACLEGSCKA